MILPIVAYGDQVLRKKCVNIDIDYEALPELISNMFEAMYNARGVGLAAPQIGRSIRLFIMDTDQLNKDETEQRVNGIKEVFINAEIIERSEETDLAEEGCLSIPTITGEVERPVRIQIRYMNENFEEKVESFTGLNARVIQHEYDHIEGILFTDHMSSLKRKLLKRKLNKVSKGKIDVGYKMRFPAK